MDGAGSTKRRSRAPYTNDRYAGFVSRIMRALGRRVSEGDTNDLAMMIDLQRQLDIIIAESVTAMRERFSFSWADIADAAGITKQAAHARWAHVEAKPRQRRRGVR